MTKETKRKYKIHDPLKARNFATQHGICIHCGNFLRGDKMNIIWNNYSFKLCEKCEHIIVNTIVYDYYSGVLEQKDKAGK